MLTTAPAKYFWKNNYLISGQQPFHVWSVVRYTATVRPNVQVAGLDNKCVCLHDL